MRQLMPLALLMAGFPAAAEWTDQTGNVEISTSRPAFNRATRQLDVTITVTNATAEIMEGEKRIFISDPSIPLAGEYPVNESGTPYIEMGSEVIESGGSVSVTASFALTRAPLSFDAAFWVDIPEQDTALADLVFADEALAACVARTAEDNEWLTVSQFVAMDCSGEDITSLTGVEHLTALETVNIAMTAIDDLSPVLELASLASINVDGVLLNDPGQIETLSDREVQVEGRLSQLLSELNYADSEFQRCVEQNASYNGFPTHTAQVRDLFCFGPSIVSVEDLVSFPWVNRLSVRTTNVSDFSSVALLNHLTYLDISERSINVPGFTNELLEAVLTKNELQTLALTRTAVDNFAVIADETSLELVLVESQAFSQEELDILVALPNLTGLLLGKTSITDFTPILNAENVTFLRLSDAAFDDAQLSALAPMLPNIERLDLFFTGVTTLAPLANADNVYRLRTYGYDPIDVSALPDMAKLKELAIFLDQISNLSVISTLANLERINISGFGLSDEQVQELYKLSNLREAEFARVNDLTDSELAAMTSAWPLLESINIRSPLVTNLDPLTNMVNLADVNVSRAPLNNITGLFVDGDTAKGPNPSLTEVTLRDVPVLPGSSVESEAALLLADPNIIAFASFVHGTPIAEALAGVEDPELAVCLSRNDYVVTGQVEYVYCGRSDVISLSGIEAFTAIQSIDISSTEVTDLSPLLALPNLVSVDIDGLILDDPSQLDALRDNGVEIVGELTSLIADIEFADPVLQACVEYTGFTKVSELRYLSCYEEDLPGGYSITEMTSLEGIEHLTALERFNLDESGVTDFSPLYSLPNLISISLSGDNTNDAVLAGFAENIPQLESLNFSGSMVTDYAPLSLLLNLESLRISSGTFDDEDLTSIAALPNLLYLSLFDLEITDLSSLSGAQKLLTLRLSLDQPVSLLPLADIASLKNVDVNRDTINDFSEISGLTQILVLDIRGEPLSPAEVEVLYGLSQLEELDIWRQIPLDDEEFARMTSALPNLTTLEIYSDLVTNLDPVTNLSKIGRISVYSGGLLDISGLFVDGDITNDPLPSLYRVDYGHIGAEPDAPVIAQVAALEAADNLTVYGTLTIGESIATALESVEDEALRQCIADRAQNSGYRIANQITFVSCFGSNIETLSGIEQFTALDFVSLPYTNVTDISALEGLTELRNLDLAWTLVQDLTPLSTLNNLYWLDISNTEVTDLSPLLELSDLQSLNIDGLVLDDPAQVDALRSAGVEVEGELTQLLSTLEFTDPALTQCVVNTGYRTVAELSFFSCENAELSSLEGIEQLTALSDFFVYGETLIEDYSPLYGLEKLTRLALYSSTVTQDAVEGIAMNLPTLNSLTIENSSASDFGTLANLTNLNSLSLRSDQFDDEDLLALSTLTELTSLRLSDANLSTVESLASLVKLNDLSLSHDAALDLSPLQSLSLLTSLSLSLSAIENFSALSGLQSLTSLSLHGGEISLEQLGYLYQIGSLRYTDFDTSEPIDDAELLLLVDAWPELRRLQINNGSITHLDPVDVLTNVNSVNIRSQNLSDISGLFVNDDIEQGPLPSLDWVSLRSLLVEPESELERQVQALENSESVNTYFEIVTGLPLASVLPLIVDDELRTCAEAASNGLIATGQLTTLQCSDIPVTTLEGIEGLDSLEYLNISETLVSDLTPLFGLESLRTLDIHNLPIEDVTQINALREAGVEVIGEPTQLLSSITFADSVLAQCVANTDALRVSEIRYLDCYSYELADLGGLESLTSLVSVFLGENQVQDFTPILGLSNLTSLRIEGPGVNQSLLNDMGEALLGLRDLELYNPDIVDFSALANFEQMSNLSISSDAFDDEDVTALSAMSQLFSLTLYNTPVSDLSPLNGLPISSLTLQDLPPIYLTDLLGLQSLTRLSISRESIALVEDLELLKNLTSLFIFGGVLTQSEVNVVYTLSDLEYLNIERETAIDDAELARMTQALPKLRDLFLEGRQITTLSSLSHLENLTWLQMSRTSVTDLSPLFVNGDIAEGPLPSLRGAYLGTMAVTSESDIEAQVQALIDEPNVFVEVTLINGSFIGDVFAVMPDADLRACVENSIWDLAVAEQVTELHCGYSNVSDLSGIQGLINLESVYLDATQVTDLSPLFALEQLTELSIDGLELADPSQLEVLEQNGVVISGNPFIRIDIDFDAITDPILRACVEAVNPEYVSDVTFISCYESDLASLAGIEQFDNLGGLYLGENNISDYSPLTGLTSLQGVQVSGSAFDNAALAYLLPSVDLYEVFLVNTGVNNFAALTELANLGSLYVVGPAFNDEAFSTLSSLSNLVRLDLSDTSITSLEPVVSLSNLDEFWVFNGPKLDVRPVGEAQNLNRFSINRDAIEDFDHIASLTNLTHFEVFAGALTDEELEKVYVLSQLTRLDVARVTPLDDERLLTLTTSLPNLEALSLHGFGITHLDPLQSLTNLSFLYISGTSIVDGSGLFVGGDINNEPLPNLSNVAFWNVPLLPGSNLQEVYTALQDAGVYVSGNLVEGEPVVDFLDALADVELKQCIQNSAPDAQVTGQVQDLYCWGFSSLADLSGLEQLENLSYVDLSYTSVTDISALLDLESLTYVSLYGVTLDDPSQIQTLLDKGVSVNY